MGVNFFFLLLLEFWLILLRFVEFLELVSIVFGIVSRDGRNLRILVCGLIFSDFWAVVSWNIGFGFVLVKFFDLSVLILDLIVLRFRVILVVKFFIKSCRDLIGGGLIGILSVV